MNEHDIFLAALEIADPVQRAEFLHRTCAGNEALRRQVEALLAAHARSGEFLDVPALQQVAAGVAETGTEPPGGKGEIDLSFLQPSTVPGSLGRLGHYEIQEVIGQGGYGIVLKAIDELLQRVVAIKVMAPELAATSPARKRFLREARAAAAVRHENVVHIYAVEDQPLPYLVMEYIAGPTLQQKLDASGPLDAAEVARIGQQIARGLEAAHALGLIHRDIKPGNILLAPASGRDSEPSRPEAGAKAVLTDFGLARTADDASITQSGVIAGTPLYMSPEQARGETLDPRSDLFSLGSVLYVMCSGRPPFRAATTLAVLKRVAEDQPRPIQEIIPEAPAWLTAIIARLHAKKAADRYGSAREVADLLGRCLAALPVGQDSNPVILDRQEENPVATPLRPRPRRTQRWVAAVAVIVALLGGLSLTEATGVTNVRGTVIRLFSPEGTLVVEVDDPGVSVSIDGEDMVITGAGAKEIRLKPGQYKVLASKDGQVVSQELVTVTKNGRQVVRVSKEAGPAGTDPERAAALALSKLGCTFRVRLKDGRINYYVPPPAEPFTVLSVYPPLNPLPRRVVESEVVPALLALPDLEQIDGNAVVPFTADDLARLADAPVGRNLAWIKCGLDPSPEILAVLARFPRLSTCDFVGTMLDDDLVAFAKGLPRRIAYLSLLLRPESRIGVRGMAALTGLPLQKLAFTCPGFDRGFAKAIAGMPQLEYFAAHPGPQGIRMTIDDEVAAELAASKSLRTVYLNGNGFTDASLESFRGMTSLRRLEIVNNWNVEGNKVTKAGVEKLAAARPDLRIEWDGGVIEPSSTPDRRAAEWVLSRGGVVKVRVNGTQRDVKAVDELPAGAFAVETVSLWKRPGVTDDDLARFVALPRLESLVLSYTDVGDAGLAHVQKMTGLVALALDGTAVSDAGVEKLRGLTRLWNLNLGGTIVGDEGAKHLQSLRNLEYLTLAETRVTDAGLEHLKGLNRLHYLDLHGTQVGDAGLAHLKDLTNLKTLQLATTRITDGGLKHLEALAKLEILTLYENRELTNAGLERLKGLKTLRGLDLGHTKVDDAGLEHLKALPNLEGINLAGTTVTDAGLKTLHGLVRLKQIRLDGTKVSPEGIAALRKALPQCEIMRDGVVIEPKGPAPLTTEQRKSLEWVLGNGGHLTLIIDGKWRAVEPDGKLPAGPFVVDAVNLTRVANLDADAVENLRSLPPVALLFTVNTNRSVDDGTLAKLAAIPGLTGVQRLDLRGTRVTDAGLAHVKAFTNLQSLALSGNQITDASLAHVKALTGLTELHLASTQITSAGLAHLRELKLAQLYLGECGKVDDTGMEHLANMTSLGNLNLAKTEVVDAGLKHLARLRNLQGLTLAGSAVTDAGLERLAALTNLAQLNLAGTQVTNAGLQRLRPLANLKELDLRGAKIGDEGLMHVKALPNLTSLNLNYTQVTEAGVKKLAAALPSCKIEWDGGVIEPTQPPR